MSATHLSGYRQVPRDARKKAHQPAPSMRHHTPDRYIEILTFEGFSTHQDQSDPIQ